MLFKLDERARGRSGVVMPNARLVWRVKEDMSYSFIEEQINQLARAGRCKDDIRQWLELEIRQTRMSYLCRLMFKRLIVVKSQAFDYQKALLRELRLIALESGTSVKQRDGPNDGDYTWSVAMHGILHTMHGKPVGCNHMRKITFRLGSGPLSQSFWELEILDKISTSDRCKGFWANLSLYWGAYESGLELGDREHENSWHRPGDTSRYHTINDGMSYQGESTRYFDDVLRLVHKLPDMLTYERACK